MKHFCLIVTHTVKNSKPNISTTKVGNSLDYALGTCSLLFGEDFATKMKFAENKTLTSEMKDDFGGIHTIEYKLVEKQTFIVPVYQTVEQNLEVEATSIEEAIELVESGKVKIDETKWEYVSDSFRIADEDEVQAWNES